jgi:hypothetical protein
MSRVVLEQLMIVQAVKNFPNFMEHEVSLPFSQVPYFNFLTLRSSRLPPTRLTVGPLLVCCPQLFVQHIDSYASYLKAVRLSAA